MFDTAQIDYQAVARVRANDLMVQYNQSLQRVIDDFKTSWRIFWDADLSVDVMQATLDTLASSWQQDGDNRTDALTAYFAKAVRLITFLRFENPLAFSDGRMEATGARVPGSGNLYQEFVEPGWILDVDPTNGRLLAVRPCEWVDT